MKFRIITHFSDINKGQILYHQIECPFCKKKYLNLFLHFIRSNCGIKFIELILKGKKNELKGRKKAILNGWK